MEEKLIYLGGSSVGERDGPGLSSTVIQLGERAIMVDCGLEILTSGQYGLPDFANLASRGIKISAAVLTHCHLDHVGSTGVASEQDVFESGAGIYGAPQTNAWLPMVLNETWGRGVGKGYPSRVFDMLKTIPHGEFEILPGVLAFTGAAGHVPGALYVIIKTLSGKKILFCGDMSWHDQETVKGSLLPDDLPDCWLPDIIAVTDLTNPSLTKFDYELEMSRLSNHAIESLAKNRIVVFAAFAYGRTQNLTQALAKAFADAGLQYPVYADGSGTDIFRVFRENRWSPNDREISFGGIKLVGANGVKKGRQREELLAGGGPLVIVTTAGFGDGGPVKNYLERGVENPNFEFIASSWLLPGCTMDWLIKKVQKRTKTGSKVFLELKDDQNTRETMRLEVRCEASRFRPSAHGGLSDNVEMTKKIAARRSKKLEAIMLTHGSQESKRAAAPVLGQYADSIIFVCPQTTIKI